MSSPCLQRHLSQNLWAAWRQNSMNIPVVFPWRWNFTGVNFLFSQKMPLSLPLALMAKSHVAHVNRRQRYTLRFLVQSAGSLRDLRWRGPQALILAFGKGLQINLTLGKLTDFCYLTGSTWLLFSPRLQKISMYLFFNAFHLCFPYNLNQYPSKAIVDISSLASTWGYLRYML